MQYILKNIIEGSAKNTPSLSSARYNEIKLVWPINKRIEQNMLHESFSKCYQLHGITMQKGYSLDNNFNQIAKNVNSTPNLNITLNHNSLFNVIFFTFVAIQTIQWVNLLFKVYCSAAKLIKCWLQFWWTMQWYLLF